MLNTYPAFQTLTPAQRAAVSCAATQRVTLIQGKPITVPTRFLFAMNTRCFNVLRKGPPGTGKTFTISAIVAVWLKRRSKSGKILVTANTNAAANNISDALTRHKIPNARIGHEAYSKARAMESAIVSV